MRKLIERSGIQATFVYLGTVYGPGKLFEKVIFPNIAAGKWKNFDSGSCNMVLTHVEDAARGIIRIAGCPASRIKEKIFVVTDNYPVKMKSFTDLAASLMGVAPPGQIPRWLASVFAGRPVVETMLCDYSVKPSKLDFTGHQIKYPSYLEGLPPTMRMLGYSNKP